MHYDSPAPLPLPAGPSVLVPGQSASVTPAGEPVCWIMALGGWFGSNIRFTVRSSSPVNLGIYGPNPTQIGPPFGRMRAPKINQPDSAIASCQGNFRPGVYYLVVRSGDNGAPVAPVEIDTVISAWKPFG